MRATRWWPVVAVALVGTLLVSAPTGQTQAQWRESATTTVSGPSSDVFKLSAMDVPSTVDGSGRNTPRVNLVNHSRRQTSNVDVRSTRLSAVVGGDSSALLSTLSIAYTFGSGPCGGSAQNLYWDARAAGQVSDGTTYTRNQDPVSGARLAPGETKVLCPRVTLPYSATAAGVREAYLAHAGRAVDISTTVRQSTAAPATWQSSIQTATSRFQVAMPTPTAPSGQSVCRTTNGSGREDSNGWFGGFYFAWPDSDSSSEVDTPAMAGGWEILRRDRSGTWQPFAYTANPRARRIIGLDSVNIDPDVRVVREFTLRGYPYAGDKTRYVEADWIVRAYSEWDFWSGEEYWVCENRVANPGKGPVNIP